LSEEISSNNDEVMMVLAGTGLSTRDWMGKGDHYFKVWGLGFRVQSLVFRA
jgi:hypothetical protein